MTDATATDFRRRLSALRLAQEEAAQAAGIGRGTLIAFENGDGRISLGNLRRLMAVVGLALATRDASRRPTLDELSRTYATAEPDPPRRRASKKRRTRR